MDFFQHKDETYIIAVDYFPRDVEVCLVSRSVNTCQTILQLKKIFSRHGIPEILFTDDGPQFDSREFTTFSNDWHFEHITSSPKYPQSNGEVERAVQTMKMIMNKRSDEYLALLTYRDTPLHNGYSPAQLSLGRKLRTRTPCHPDELLPQTPDYDQVKKKDREYRTKMKSYYDHRHRVVEREELSLGDRVWIPDMKVEGTVIKPHDRPRSVVIQTPNGKVRRNRRMTRRAPKVSPRSSFALTSRDSPEPFMRHGPVTDLPTNSAAIQDSLPDAIRVASQHLPTPPGNQTVQYKSSQKEAWSNCLRPRGVIKRPQRYVEEC